jgi:23S rRNA (pseudouridine1915-N3)-methyltransferase
MKVRFIWPGKTKDEHLRALINEYLKRLSRFARCEIVEVREGDPDDRSSRVKETQRMLAAISKRAFPVILDLQGREWSSPELARELQRWEKDGMKEVAIVIGGPEGISAPVAACARQLWRLSRLTLTHEMARVVAVEQIYRAYTINHGLPYQK